MPAKTINLLPQTDFDQTPLGRFLRWALSYGRYIVVCTEIVVLLAFIYRFSLDRKITDLNEEIEQKSAIVAANQEFELKFRELQDRFNIVSNLKSTQNEPVSLLQHLQQITPQGIRFSSLIFDGDMLTITAQASANENLSLFLSQLKSSELLTNINVVFLTKKNTSTSETSFQIKASLKKGATQ